MSIHEIIQKINTDKREIAFSRWKARVVVGSSVLLLLGEIAMIIYVFVMFK